MDALGISPGMLVADIGAGDGYFTFHLAARVGPSGCVYAVEIDKSALDKIQRHAQREKLAQVKGVLGATNDPRLPANALDAALIVNAYHEMRDYDAMLAGVFRALKPGGRLAIIDGAIAPGEDRDTYFRRHRIPAELVRADAERAGFRFLREEEGFLRPRDKKKFYFLHLEKPK
jgi:predicted methyltransferase